MVKAVNRTKPTPCTPARKFAHHWRIPAPRIPAPEDKKWVWGHCKYCKKARLFRTSWWSNSDAKKNREARLKVEKKLRRQLKRKKVTV
jgi:hypothetical protein